MDLDKNKELVLKLLEEVRDLKEENLKLEKLVEIYMTETAATLDDINKTFKKSAGIAPFGKEDEDKWAVAITLKEHKEKKKRKKKFLNFLNNK